MSATVAITIAGRAYEIACDAGQEETLRALAVEIDGRAQQLLKAVGPVSDAKLLAMVSLTLADDLAEARGKGAAPKKPAEDDQTDARMAAGLDRLTARIEAIADRIQKN
jgi:cell division protein ZapA